MFTLSVVKGHHSNSNFLNRADTLPNSDARWEYSDTGMCNGSLRMVVFRLVPFKQR